MFRELSGTQTPNWLKYSVTALMLLEKLKATVERKEKMFKVSKRENSFKYLLMLVYCWKPNNIPNQFIIFSVSNLFP